MNQTIKPVPPKAAPLGRGLSALFGDADASYAAPGPAESKNPSHLAVAWLQPGAFQPRRYFDEEGLKGLAESIRERGILEPLVVRPVKDTKDAYEIIAGERRWRAAQMAGLHDVPVVLRHLTDREALEFGLIENVQRQDLSPLEEAEGYKRLLDDFEHSQEGLAKIVGKSRAHIGNMLRILTLPLPLKQMIEKGDLTLGHARALIPTANPLKLAQIIVKKGLSVRQAEELAKREGHHPHPRGVKTRSQIDFAIADLEKDMGRVMGLKVKITPKGRGGIFAVAYNDLDHLEAIIARMKSLS